MRWLLVWAAVFGIAWPQALAMDGADLPLRSNGAAAGAAWQLQRNGYVGGYVVAPAAGTVTVRVDAAALGAPSAAVVLNLAGERVSFDVPAGGRTWTHEAPLPAGTYFLRLAFPGDATRAGHGLVVRSVDVAGGATLMSESTDALALAAADTAIAQHRRGPARVWLPEVAPGTTAKARLVRHAFNFGGIISGHNSSDVLVDHPPAGSDAEKFQRFVDGTFNTIVPSNGGKWSYNEPSPGEVTMGFVDTVLDYAQERGMRARMHTLLWAKDQEPAWVKALLAEAAEPGDRGAAAKAELRAAISRRIAYYIGAEGRRGARYIEVDILNESLHQPKYWQVFGAEGVAGIYNEAASAAAAAGRPGLGLYLNEFNVLQWSTDPAARVDDPYANWYSRNIAEVRDAGGAVTGVGVQYYADGRSPAEINTNAHSPARITQALQNLAVLGLPISLTEFGLASDTPQDAGARMLGDTMRIVFGTPEATTFMIWGWWAPPGRTATAGLVDGAYELTPMGERWGALMSEWDTRLEAPVEADGSVAFTGFYGDYEIEAGGRIFRFTLARGQSDYRPTALAAADGAARAAE